jgi:hypothetical protein
MRLPAFLFALALLAALAFGISASQQTSNIPNSRPIPKSPELWGGYTTARMWRRAEIRVVPLDQVDLDKAKLQSLRDQAARAQSQGTGIWFADPYLRKQLSEQLQLINDLLKFAEHQQANKAKTPTALEVERRLNQIQGETMCEACHSGIVAKNATLR